MKCRIAPCFARPQQIILSLLALDPQAIFATAVICRRRAQMGQLSMSLKVMEKHRERMRMRQNARSYGWFLRNEGEFHPQCRCYCESLAAGQTSGSTRTNAECVGHQPLVRPAFDSIY